MTVPEAFDPPDAPVEDEPALPLVAPAVPEPLALVEDLPPQLTTKASTTSSAAPLVSDMATPKGRIIRHGPSPDEPMTSMLAPVVGLAEWIRGTRSNGSSLTFRPPVIKESSSATVHGALRAHRNPL